MSAVANLDRLSSNAPAPNRPKAPLQTVRVGLLGYGRVGQAVATVAERERARLAAAGIEVQFSGALVRDTKKLRSGPAIPLSADPADIVGRPADVLVEVLGGLEPSLAIVSAALAAGIPVVSANKSLVACHGAELSATAAKTGASFAFEAAVLAGVPCLGAIGQRPLASDAARIEGIVNGTSQFIVSALDRGVSFEDALAEAIDKGYAEPDSAADTSGRDAAEKLTIVLRLAGRGGVSPGELFKLPLQSLAPDDLAAARRLGGAIKPVAIANLVPGREGAWVGPAFVVDRHPLFATSGVENVLRLVAADGRTVTFAGPGAGPDVTATTILDDVVELARTALAGSNARQARGDRWPATTAAVFGAIDHADHSFAQPPASRWFVRTGDRSVLTDVLPWSAVANLADAARATGARAIAIPVVE